MKTLLLLAVSLSIALAGAVNAEDQDEVKQPKNRTKAPQPARTVTPVGPHFTPKPVQTYQYHQKVQPTARAYTPPVMPKTNMPRTYTTTPADTSVQKKTWQNQNQNRNWNSVTWAEARRRHQHDHHDRHWWRSHYTRFALFGSGYYFWDGGYWFPAYGYDPGYNAYAYNEPIYGYNDLDPARVIANVQTELQQLGYYRDAVDGTMGPATRAALANYQRDRGLSITAAIDGPTLHSLGLE